MNKYFKYIVLGLGLCATILLTIGLVVFNKAISNESITISKNMKILINDLIGFGEILVVLNTFIVFLHLNNGSN
ncbi:MAG: hypothetical protein K6G48_05585 [Acholeplasmatales bacterium]|nr:hypothetical protein [Acholeplasmatales bacterium]